MMIDASTALKNGQSIVHIPIRAPRLEDFEKVDHELIPYRFVFNNKRKIKILFKKGDTDGKNILKSHEYTFEYLKEAVQECFPEIKKVKFPVNNMIFQYPNVPEDFKCKDFGYIENQEQWEAFRAGPIKRIKECRRALKIINKKSRKRQRTVDPGQTVNNPAAKRAKQENKAPKLRGNKAQKPVSSSIAYIKANFRGALQEYFQRVPDGKNANVMFVTQENDMIKPPEMAPVKLPGQNQTRKTKCYISTCKVTWGQQEWTGMGHAPAKKASVQFAALDVILKMQLVTPDEHRKVHP